MMYLKMYLFVIVLPSTIYIIGIQVLALCQKNPITFSRPILHFIICSLKYIYLYLSSIVIRNVIYHSTSAMLLNFSQIQENTRKVLLLTGGAPPNFRRHRFTFSAGAFVFPKLVSPFRELDIPRRPAILACLIR